MVDEIVISNFDNYDTTINIIGGLRDLGVIYKVIDSYYRPDDSLTELISSRNELNLRTERSRERVERAIKTAFLNFINQDHEDLVRQFFSRKSHLPESELVLFWQFSLTNRLFREISSRVFVKMYFSGRSEIAKDDIVAYLKDFLSRNEHLNLNWSETTIQTLATKYLNLMTKLHFLEGARKKSFRYIRPSAEALVLFLYFAGTYEPDNRNILKNEMLPLSFVTLEDITERLKKLALKGYFDMDFTGTELNIELKFSYNGICDVLYHGS